MKRIATVVVIGASLAAVAAWAGPLEKHHVAAEAKWVIHLDADAFKATQVGTYIGGALDQDQKLAKLKGDLKAQFDFEFDWRRITALTAYGTGFQPGEQGKGVLLVYTGMDVQKLLEAVIDKAQGGNADIGPVKRLEPGPLPLYLIKDDLYVAPQPGRPVLVSKFHQEILKARPIFAGQATTLAASDNFGDLLSAPGAFFFVAAAQGFNDLPHIPPKAEVFKQAEGLRLVISENTGKVGFNAMLKTKTAEVSQKIQQVLQGLIALGALAQSDNQDLQQLVQAVSVSAGEKSVTVNLQLPVEKVLAEIKKKEAQKKRQE
jgi:hypothetical protein